jgi:GrpB-like predicted nucleotidyltransferase (UPF0157 family)
MMPTSEERLRAVTVGELKPLNGTVVLEPYNPIWPKMYLALESGIRSALGDNVVRIEHVGSTSVQGLSAKAIIDVVLEVSDSADESAYVPALEAQGYVTRVREPDWFEHRLLKSPKVDGNVHVFSAGCEETERMVAFREWLRTNERDRQLYERTKQHLASMVWTHVQNYADAKTDIINEIMVRAGYVPRGRHRFFGIRSVPHGSPVRPREF